MIDTTRTVTVMRSGLNIMQQGDRPTDLFTFGKILLLRDDHCVVLVSAGPRAGKKINMPLQYPAVIDGNTYHVDIPDVFEKAPAKARAPRHREGETKIDRCRALYKANAGASKDVMIKMFIEQVGCTPAGAVTYYLTCKKG